VTEDRPVRLFAEILGRCDWSKWEAKYDGRLAKTPKVRGGETAPGPRVVL